MNAKKVLRIGSAGAVIALVLTAGVAMAGMRETRSFTSPDYISRAQEILVDEGLLSAGSYTPGQLDEPTRQALTTYQERHALNDSGNLDDDTYAMLLSHEISYPWGGEETSQPAAAAEPVTPVAAPEPSPAPQVAEAPPVPEPAPSTAEVKEAPAPAPAPAPEPSREAARKMPATASSLPLLVLTGLSLLGVGILLLRSRAA